MCYIRRGVRRGGEATAPWCTKVPVSTDDSRVKGICMAETQVLPGISVFFPALHDEGTIARMVTEALAVRSTLTVDHEVLVVNDGSTDGTAAVLEALAHEEPRLRVIHHPANRGYGGALVSGFCHASKDLIFYTDGDGQYDVHDLRRLVAL